MLQIPGIVSGLVGVVIGIALWVYWMLFGLGDAGPSIALAGVLVLLHWVGLHSVLSLIARSRGAALLVSLLAPPVGGLAVLMVWYWDGSNATLFPLLAVCTLATVVGGAMLRAPTGISATPGPMRATAPLRPPMAAVGLALVIALSLFWWVLLFLDVLFLTDASRPQ